MMSRFVIALLFFVSIGLLTTKVIEPIKDGNNSTESQEKTWTEWALTDFNRQKSNPARIVIIGSSLVLTPVNLADAHFHNHTVNGAIHHKSDLLKLLLAKQSNNETENFNFALPGLMPSDAYLITKLLLTGKNRPKLLIYGVGPRDFVDNVLAGATSTDPYRCLTKYLPSELANGSISLYRGKDWQSHLDYFLAQHFSIYGQRNEILAICAKEGESLYTKASLLIAGSDDSFLSRNKFTVADIHNLLPTYKPMAIGINQCLFQSTVQLESDRFAKNLDEYRVRYRKLNWDTFTCQSRFFVETLKIAHDNDMRILVVAMPITSINKKLLPDYIFALYRNNLAVLSKSFGADFLDLDKTSCFNDQDFGDTVHLSTSGSIKMIKLIADHISANDLNKTNMPDRSHLAQTGTKL